MDIRQRELKLQEQEMELDFQRQMRQLELQKGKLGLEQEETKLRRLGHPKEHDKGGKPYAQQLPDKPQSHPILIEVKIDLRKPHTR
jgi:hypothetical protein